MSQPANTTATTAPPASATWPRRAWLTGRILATLGAIGFAIFAWTYLVRVSDANFVLNLNPGDVDIQVSGGFAWALLSVFAVFFAPLVWLRVHPWLITASAILLFLSGAAASALTLLAPHTLFNNGASLTLVGGLVPHEITGITEVITLTGFLFAALFALLLAVGGLLLLVALIQGGNRSTAPAITTTASLPGAGGLTLGLILFLIGTLSMGWSAVNCTDRPLFLGQCHGLTYTGVAHYGISTHTTAFDPIASLFAVPTLLFGGAVLIVLGLFWWRRLTPGLMVWNTLYLATATFFFIVGYAGTGAIDEHATDLGLEAGTWTAQSGLWVAGLGLLIGWIALIPLWFRALRPANRSAA